MGLPIATPLFSLHFPSPPSPPLAILGKMVAIMVSSSALAARPVARATLRATRSAPRVVAVAAQKQTLAEKATSAVVKPATLAIAANIMMAAPAMAAEGKLFDFNLTLPFMAAEFLLLMVFLDKTWFTPVGELLDKRDSELRGMVGEVKDNSAQLAALQEEAEEILRAARAESQAQVKAVKDECQKDMDAKYADVKAKVDKELSAALASLAKEEEEAMKAMESQVEALSNDIIARVLPEGVTL